MAKPPHDEEDGIARERDEIIKRMFATPPKTHKGEPKKAPKKTKKG